MKRKVIIYNVQDFIDPENFSTENMRLQKMQDLITTIQFSVSPNSWDTTGGNGSIRAPDDSTVIIR